MSRPLEPDDPYEFVAMQFPAEEGVDADAAMARCIVEEFALMGFPPERILRIFQIPTYTGSYDIRERRGEPFVTGIIADVFGRPPSPVPKVVEAEGA
ncbi:MAG: hypothetical protein V3V06_02640 [Dehalococcoidia bacterium]